MSIWGRAGGHGPGNQKRRRLSARPGGGAHVRTAKQRTFWRMSSGCVAAPAASGGRGTAGPALPQASAAIGLPAHVALKTGGDICRGEK